MRIISDNKWRPVKYGYELPRKWRKEFDWMEGEEFDNAEFAIYRGWAFPLSEFVVTTPGGELSRAGWDGYDTETYFSGTVIKLSRDGEAYKIGRYYS